MSLGNTLMDLHEPASAAASYRKAIELDANSASAHSNLGNALRELGRLDDALASHRAALECDPRSAFACMNLGTVLRISIDWTKRPRPIGGRRRSTRTLRKHTSVSATRSPNADARRMRSTAFDPPSWRAPTLPPRITISALLSAPPDALPKQSKRFTKALELDADVAETHTSLGNALADHGQITQAVASHRNAISLNPNLAEAHNNLGNALKDLARLDEAIESYRKALTINPDYAAAQSNILFVLNYAAKTDPAICRGGSKTIRPHAGPAQRRAFQLMEMFATSEAAACGHRLR